MSLDEYVRKRDFARSPEPVPQRSKNGSARRFVVQKHAASRLHYDFRLELDGTLKSWAVPKGIPLARGEKRLAIQVEDHPIGYFDFEGTIPKGQYGGGTVMVWDYGTFDVLGKPELRKGRLHFFLRGTKLVGEWYLVQMHGGKQWLLIRGGEDNARISRRKDQTSAVSGKTMEQLGVGGRVWRSASNAPSVETKLPRKSHSPAGFIEPMEARLTSAPPSDCGWLYEVKFDGFRALAYKRRKNVRLLSRNEKDFAAKFPEVADAIATLDTNDCILDGEIVALDEAGRSSFQMLQAFELGEARPPIIFYAFDLLRLNGHSLLQLPLEERRARLEKVLRNAPSTIRYSPALEGSAKALLAQVGKLGLEGLIGKRRDSAYQPGRRSGAWIKLKLSQEQEMVIGGYTDPAGTRKHFGALLIGYHKQKRLEFAGKVGTGFDAKGLRSLHDAFIPLEQPECPFADLPERRSGRWGQTISPAQMKRCHWLRPVLACQVRFANWTRDGKIRQPVFLGLREDKAAAEVVREIPA